MSGYDATGVDDDRVAQAARRIVRQYHLEQSDRSEDSGGTPAARPSGTPDDIHGLRLAIDEMTVKVEHMQRLMANREDLFLATLERVDRNLARTDGRLDALAAEVARIDARPGIATDALRTEQRDVVALALQEHRDMLMLGRTLLDEARTLHGTALAAAGIGADGASRAG